MSTRSIWATPFCAALSVLAMACSAPDASETTARVSSPIINGQPATSAELFATVALIGSSDGEPFCTGTLIAPTVVVTAAHCLFTEQGALAASDIAIVAGVLDAYGATTEQRYAVAQASSHSGYSDASDPGPLGKDDDIAVLVVSTPVEGQTPVPVLAFEAIDQYLQMGTLLTITGYGQRDVDGVDPNLFGLLYIAQTPYQQRTDNEMLAGGAGSPDTCTGDSGGPAYVDIEGTKFLLAAVSRASEVGLPPCGSGGIYTLAAAYDSFLTAQSSGGYSGATVPSAGATSTASGSGAATSSSGGSQDGGDGEDEDEGGCSAHGRGANGTSLAWLLLLALAIRRRA